MYSKSRLRLILQKFKKKIYSFGHIIPPSNGKVPELKDDWDVNGVEKKASGFHFYFLIKILLPRSRSRILWPYIRKQLGYLGLIPQLILCWTNVILIRNGFEKNLENISDIQNQKIPKQLIRCCHSLQTISH